MAARCAGPPPPLREPPSPFPLRRPSWFGATQVLSMAAARRERDRPSIRCPRAIHAPSILLASEAPRLALHEQPRLASAERAAEARRKSAREWRALKPPAETVSVE